MRLIRTRSPSAAAVTTCCRLLFATAAAVGALLLLGGCNNTSGSSSGEKAAGAPSDPNVGEEPSDPASAGGATSTDVAPEAKAVDPDRTCMTADDCVHTGYPTRVRSVDECYCPSCPSNFGTLEPINQTAHAERVELWKQHCTNWAEEAGCDEGLCNVPRDPVCTAGRCALPEWKGTAAETPPGAPVPKAP